ncbi:sulfotransferase domain-containing protein [Hyphomicrobium sp. MC1]|uniref:sulfotransferase domain-containing protein n=1 Tax=Hyphomicrobium sp. (strain MC1) TaxID=717785 RepID=UPI000213D5C5|nr:sulfotransferase domain-containing protein [Hyphomicrobium sp. MC1]CCB65045.1 protein of unknown function [Hyphomicrobium sp. MC1]
MEPRYLVITLGKSGSNWLNNILAALPGIEKFDMGAHGITGIRVNELEKLGPGKVMYTHLRHSEKVCAEIARLNVRPFYIYRDIRDALVSEYFHKAYLDPRFKTKNPILKHVDERSAFNYRNIVKWSTTLPVYNDALAWVADSSVPSAKFEDLVQNPEETLRSLLTFHGMDFSDTEIKSALQKASFQAMAGRTPGQENRNSHYRKGIVGDWKNYFSAKQHADLWLKAGRTLSRLGYQDHPSTFEKLHASLRYWTGPALLGQYP